MTCVEYLCERLKSEMIEGNMHGCLRNVGRLVGGLLASGDLRASDVDQLAEVAVSLAINKTEAETKWSEALTYGRAEPVRWSDHMRSRPDRVLDWSDTISDDYQLPDTTWSESIEVEEPKTWDPVGQISEYLSLLFSSEEHVGYVTESWLKDDRRIPTRGAFDRTCGQLLEELSKYQDIGAVFGDVDPEVGAWIRFNPLDGQGVRDANVTDYRFALVESDKMSIDEQRGIYEKLELPIVALVHSGNKSLHAIVRIEADSFEQYKKRVDLLYDVCDKNGLPIDRQNRNPSRLSRMPGAMRAGQKQYLVATNLGKPSWTAWEDWIEAVNDNLPDPESLATEWDRLPDLASPLIDGVLRQGHKMLVSGPSKSGKSFLLIELCIAIAEGRKWLGWQCTQGRVLYVNLELDRTSCLHRFRDVYQALGWPADNLAKIDVWNLRGQAVPMDRLAPKLIRRAIKKHYAAVVIDPIYKVITGDENSADKMAFFCNQFDLVCHQLKAAVIYSHHHSKGVQGGKRSMDRASGSGVFARDPDALLDLLELVVSDELRKQLEDQAVCTLVRKTLDVRRPGWLEQLGDNQDLHSESHLRSVAERLLGDEYRSTLLPAIAQERLRVTRMTGWRLDATLREYPKSPPINYWFDYPIHSVDTQTVLKDACPHSEEPPWKRGSKSNKGRSSKRVDIRDTKLTEAFEMVNEDGQAKVSDVAEYLDKTTKTIRRWVDALGSLDGFRGHWSLNEGVVRNHQKLKTSTDGNDGGNGDGF